MLHSNTREKIFDKGISLSYFFYFNAGVRMNKLILSSIFFMTLPGMFLEAADTKTVVKEWKEHDILIQSKMQSEYSDISKGVFIEITITNKMSTDIRIMYIKGYKPERSFAYKLVCLPSMSDVKSLQNDYPPWEGKLVYVFIKPQETYSLKINLCDYFNIEKGKDYSLGIRGWLYYDGIMKHIEFNIKDIRFTVES